MKFPDGSLVRSWGSHCQGFLVQSLVRELRLTAKKKKKRKRKNTREFLTTYRCVCVCVCVYTHTPVCRSTNKPVDFLVIAVNWFSGYRKMVVTAVETIFGLPENGCDRGRNHFRVTGKWL